MTIVDLRQKRNAVWESAKAFAESHKTENGTLTAEDMTTYQKFEDEVDALSAEIQRREREEARDAEFNQPANRALVREPNTNEPTDEAKGRASKAYHKAFLAMLRGKAVTMPMRNALEEGEDSEGGYLVPDEFEKTLIAALADENVMRSICHVIKTSSGDRKIPVVSTQGTASWVDEEGAYQESDDAFGQVTLGAHKLCTTIKVSEELINDSVFDLEAYIATEFARRIGVAEEAAFVAGNGSGKATGVTETATVGVTAAATTKITADEVMDLFYSVRAPYRKNGTWLVADSTIKAIRQLKTGEGQYLWQPALTLGSPDLLFGKPVVTSEAMPTIGAGNKAIAFGDFNYYWIADREGISFKKLVELYAATGQIGFQGKERVDGKLVLAEAVKTLKLHA